MKENAIEFFAFIIDRYRVVDPWTLTDPNTELEISTEEAYKIFKNSKK